MNTIKKTFLNDGVVLLKNVWDQTTIRQIIEEYDTETLKIVRKYAANLILTQRISVL